MKTRAAIAWEAGKPLTIETIEVGAPRAGEVLVEVMATGVCHTDAYTLSGADPEGLFPGDSRPRGRGNRARDRRRRDDAEGRRPRHSALHAGMPQLQNLPVAALQPVHGDPRNAGQGRHARRLQPLFLRGDRRQAAVPLHGLLDLRQFHGAAGDRARQGARGRAVRQDLLHRLRRHHRRRRGDLDGQGRGRAPMSWCSGSAASASTSSRARAWSAPTRSSASTSIRRARRSPKNSA